MTLFNTLYEFLDKTRESTFVIEMKIPITIGAYYRDN